MPAAPCLGLSEAAIRRINVACEMIEAGTASADILEGAFRDDSPIWPVDAGEPPPKKRRPAAARKKDDRNTLATTMLSCIAERAKLSAQREQLARQHSSLGAETVFSRDAHDIREAQAIMREARLGIDFCEAAIADLDERIAAFERLDDLDDAIDAAEAERHAALDAIGDADDRLASLRATLNDDTQPIPESRRTVPTKADHDRLIAGIDQATRTKQESAAEADRLSRQLAALKTERHELRGKLAAA